MVDVSDLRWMQMSFDQHPIDRVVVTFRAITGSGILPFPVRPFLKSAVRVFLA